MEPSSSRRVPAPARSENVCHAPRRLEVEGLIVEQALADSALVQQVHAVAQAAYAREAALLGCADFHPLRESLATLRRSTERLLAFLRAERVLGALTFEADGRELEITRLVVDPAAHRQGIASALLAALEQRHPRTEFVVSTAQANAPALALYRRHGFVCFEERRSPEGIALVRLRKAPSAGRGSRSVRMNSVAE